MSSAATWCGWRESNPHAHTDTSTSSLPVYQFQHSRMQSLSTNCLFIIVQLLCFVNWKTPIFDRKNGHITFDIMKCIGLFFGKMNISNKIYSVTLMWKCIWKIVNVGRVWNLFADLNNSRKQNKFWDYKPRFSDVYLHDLAQYGPLSTGSALFIFKKNYKTSYWKSHFLL